MKYVLIVFFTAFSFFLEGMVLANDLMPTEITELQSYQSGSSGSGASGSPSESTSSGGSFFDLFGSGGGDSVGNVNGMGFNFGILDVGGIPTTSERAANLSRFGFSTEIRTVESFSTRILDFLMGIVGVLSLFGVIVGGVMMTMGGVSESTLEKGKDTLLYSAIGLAVVLLAYVITTLVQTIFYSV